MYRNIFYTLNCFSYHAHILHTIQDFPENKRNLSFVSLRITFNDLIAYELCNKKINRKEKL